MLNSQNLDGCNSGGEELGQSGSQGAQTHKGVMEVVNRVWHPEGQNRWEDKKDTIAKGKATKLE
jgi:hypothetical protein